MSIQCRSVEIRVSPIVPSVLGLATTGAELAYVRLVQLYVADLRGWRAARALGYRRLITYTLQSESGTSLRAAGWRLVGEAGGGPWNRKGRPRVDLHPTQLKLKWLVGGDRAREVG